MNLNTLRPRQDGHYFADDVLKYIFLNENVWISLKIPLKFVPRDIPALVKIMAWRRPGAKPLSEPMLVFVPTHICVTRPQWVKASKLNSCFGITTKNTTNLCVAGPSVSMLGRRHGVFNFNASWLANHVAVVHRFNMFNGTRSIVWLITFHDTLCFMKTETNRYANQKTSHR